MITVHHLNNSRSQRVLWLLEELGLEYRVQRYQRDPKTMRAPESLRKVHPLGKAPIITDGDVTVAESGAIVEYLVHERADGALVPEFGTPAHRRYRYWLHFAEGSLMTPLMLSLVFGALSRPPVPWILRPLTGLIGSGVDRQFIQPEFDLLLGHVEHTLSQSEWFAGDSLTAADVQMSFPLEACAAAGKLDDRYVNIRRFLDTCHARPAYIRALERGGEYDLSFGAS